MPVRERVIDGLLLPVVLLLGGLVALRLEADVSERLRFPEIPYATDPVATNPAAPEDLLVDASSADRTVLVFVDGFRLDRVRRSEMRAMREIEDHAARVDLLAPEPADTLPVALSILTGTDREIHGISANFAKPPIDLLARIDSVPLAVRRAGGAVRWISSESRADRFELLQPFAHRITPPNAAEIAASFASTPPVGAPQLDIVHLDGRAIAQEIARRNGDDESHVAPIRIARNLDAQIAQIHESLDTSRETLAVVFVDSDVSVHDAGEAARPASLLLLVGRGVRSGTTARALAIDVAPTLALALGLPAPTSSLGVPILGVLETEASEIAPWLASLDAQRDGYRKDQSQRFRLGETAIPSGAEHRLVAERARQYRSVVAPQIWMAIAIAVLLLLAVPRFDRMLTIAAGSASAGILWMSYLGFRSGRFDLAMLSERGGYTGFAGSLLLYGFFVLVVVTIGAALLARQRSRVRGAIAQRTLLAVFGCSLVFWAVATLSWMRFDMPATGTPELSRWTLTYAAALRLLVPLSFGAIPATMALAMWFGRSESESRGIELETGSIGLAVRDA